MQNYTESFKLAMARTDDLTGRMSNYPLELDTSMTINQVAVVAAIAKDFAELFYLTPTSCRANASELHVNFPMFCSSSASGTP